MRLETQRKIIEEILGKISWLSHEIIRIGKAKEAFEKLRKMWKPKTFYFYFKIFYEFSFIYFIHSFISFTSIENFIHSYKKICLYESIVIATLLYGSETWQLTGKNNKCIEAYHHKCLRKILGVTYRNRIRNEEIRKCTGQGK